MAFPGLIGTAKLLTSAAFQIPSPKDYICVILRAIATKEEVMKYLRKIGYGDNLRKSRLHDEKGNFATWKNVFLHCGPAMLSGLLRVTIDYRPELPWIAYSAIHRLKQFLTEDSRVLEFGSGMSTIWYAKYAGQVFSVEDYRPWFDKVKGIIEAKGLDNITYKFAENETEYTTFMSDARQSFDLVMIDGTHRSKCVANASQLVKPGGILYLDNSDKDSTPAGGDMRVAESMIRTFADESNASITEITDFAPTQFFVQQGLCIKLPTPLQT